MNFNSNFLIILILCGSEVFLSSTKIQGGIKNNPVAAIFGVPATLLTQSKNPCKWLRAPQPQLRQCRRDPAIASTLLTARGLSVTHCEDQFRYVRWNCSRNKNTFRKVYRETAVLYALSAAAVTTSVARACAEGRLKKCQCIIEPKSNARKTWRWGGCSDNIKYGKRFARNFLQMRKPTADFQEAILKHNSEVGLRSVVLREHCKCHGVSGSCSVKTCWKKVPSFTEIASGLKQKYQDALKIDPGNRASRRSEPRDQKWPVDQLLYLEQGSSFCSATSGRRCLDQDNCATLCCGRGFRTQMRREENKCHCKWKEKSFDLICELCYNDVDEHICK